MSKAAIPLDSDQGEVRETALTRWWEEIQRLRLLVAQAEALTPAAFVKRVHEALPELRRAAMAAVIHNFVNSGIKED